MTVVSLDVRAARAVARALIAIGDETYRDAVTLRMHLEGLAMSGEGWRARRALERGAERMWQDATFLGLLADRVESADRRAPVPLGRLWTHAGGLVRPAGPPARRREPRGASPLAGDLGGTDDLELRHPIHVDGPPGARRARSALRQLFAALSDPLQLRSDEFGLVQVGPGRFIVLLPGVTDLSRPDPGWSEDDRSVRDLDMTAVRSSRSSAVDDNRYAAMVWEALDQSGVPRGSELLIVGHSLGADTALDLAADPRFNGVEYRVTHVVAAGYHSQPQLADLRGGTAALILQNRRDAVVIAETIGRSQVGRPFTGRLRRLAALDLSPGGVFDGVREVVLGDVQAVAAVGEAVVDRLDEVRDLATGIVRGDVGAAAAAGASLVTLTPRVERVADRAIVDVFDGGGAGAGHHPSNYVEHLDRVDDTLVVGFLASLDEAGYAASASMTAVDVSVP